jgi:uncharacterized protein (TIGR02996 family)
VSVRARYWGPLVPKSPVALRKETLETAFIPYVEATFAAHPKLSSAMLTVAQYWADEADDAVHATVVFSTRETPLWPHPCEWNRDEDERAKKDDLCSSCGNFDYMPFDDNGEAIVAFGSCCREDGSQETSMEENYLPYAVARRVPGSPNVDLEIVGGPVRAWLDDPDLERPSSPYDDDEDGEDGEADEDGDADDDDALDERLPAEPRATTPSRAHDARTEELFDLVHRSPDDDGPRQVLADHLQQKDDPQGHYIALSLAIPNASDATKAAELRSRAAELEARYGVTWLGPLADIAPPEHVVFERGFVSRVAVHLDEESLARVLAAPEWGTVEELRFLPQSVQCTNSATMKSLRAIGPLDGKGVSVILGPGSYAMAKQLSQIHVVFGEEAEIESFAKRSLPALRRLAIGSTIPAAGTTPARVGINPFTNQEMEFPAMATTFANLSPSLFRPLMAASFFRGLDELVVATLSPDAMGEWLEMSRSQRPQGKITFSAMNPASFLAGFRVQVTAETARVDMPAFNAAVSLEQIGKALKVLPRTLRLEIAPTNIFKPTPEDVAALSKDAGREVKLVGH